MVQMVEKEAMDLRAKNILQRPKKNVGLPLRVKKQKLYYVVPIMAVVNY